MPAIQGVSLVVTNNLYPRPLVPNRVGKHTDLFVVTYFIGSCHKFSGHPKSVSKVISDF